jgi:hypothetical protein
LEYYSTLDVKCTGCFMYLVGHFIGKVITMYPQSISFVVRGYRRSHCMKVKPVPFRFEVPCLHICFRVMRIGIHWQGWEVHWIVTLQEELWWLHWLLYHHNPLKILHVLLLPVNFIQFFMLQFDVNCFAINHWCNLAKVSLMQLWNWLVLEWLGNDNHYHQQRPLVCDLTDELNHYVCVCNSYQQDF